MTDNMTLCIVGATGRTGIPLTQEAFRRGHHVRALSRDADRARSLLPPGVEVVVGDARDPAVLADLVDGGHLVLDVSGPVKGGPDDYRTASTRSLLMALVDHPQVPVVHLTGAGVEHPADTPKLVDKVFRGVMKVVASSLLQDSTRAVGLLDADTRPSLVVRAPRLTDRPATGSSRVTPAVGKGGRSQVSRSDLAEALLDLAERGPADWPAGSPVVSA